VLLDIVRTLIDGPDVPDDARKRLLASQMLSRMQVLCHRAAT